MREEETANCMGNAFVAYGIALFTFLLWSLLPYPAVPAL
jgi:hypothetical protein